MADSENGLLHAFILDGRGAAKQIDWQGLGSWTPEQGMLWVHLDYTAPEAVSWLKHESQLDELVVSALLAEETRPRCDPIDNGLLIILRGINHNPGADAEDMVALRLYADSQRVISTRQRTVLSASDLAQRLRLGKGPIDSGDLVVSLSELLIARMSEAISDLEERLDTLEEHLLENADHTLRKGLLVLRRQAILLRRYLGPQREALHRLYNERVGWIAHDNRMQLRESVDRLTRYVEDLDTSRDRSAVAYEELNGRLTDQLNSRMYLLSIIAGIFLPLSFVTGLLGINVGGIPWAETPWGFGIVSVLLLLTAIGEIIYFRRRKWI